MELTIEIVKTRIRSVVKSNLDIDKRAKELLSSEAEEDVQLLKSLKAEYLSNLDLIRYYEAELFKLENPQ